MRKNLKKRWKIIAFILLLTAGGLFWYYRTTEAQRVVVETIQPERGTLTKTLEVSGFVTAKEYVKMRFAAGGKVVFLGAQEGDWVKKWQTIASIDQRSLRNSLQQSLNQYSKERNDWDQQLDNIKDRTLPKSEQRGVNNNQLDLNNTILNVQAADIAITETVLSAPFAGILVASPTTVTGVNLLATDAFELVNPQSLIFEAIVDELDIATVQQNQSAQIELDAYPDELIASTVQTISYKSAQASTGTVYQVEFTLPPQENLERYRIGMNGDVIITLATKENVLSVPLDVLISRDDQNFVKVKNGEVVEEKLVEIGLETDERVEILSGLSESDQVVLPTQQSN